MTEITIINDGSHDEPKNFSKGYLTFPFEGEDFKDFITGLLGKPQTITKYIPGTFEIHLKDLQNFYELVVQRVVQQNNGRLIQFYVKISYDDRSTVQLGSYEELITYNEVKPIISQGAQLNWDFLIQFNDKKAPEKQSIELNIIAAPRLNISEDFLSIVLPNRGDFKINIQHTARSWGSDIENLLSQQIESHLIKPNPLKKFVKKFSSQLSIVFSILIFLLSVVVAYGETNKFISSEVLKVKEFASKTRTLSQQVDYLTTYIASGVSTQQYFKVACFLLISLIIAIGLGVWIDKTASNNQTPSFLVLSKKSKDYMDETKKRIKRSWWTFLGSVLGAILTGVLANYVFKLLIE